MKLFDSHAHLDMRSYSPGQVDAMLTESWEAGLVGLIAVGGAGEVGGWGDTLEIAGRERRIWATVGIHPHLGSGATPAALDKLRGALDHPRVVALGETGLDYHYNHSPPKEQRQAFARQIRLAHDARLPIVVHTREAEEDTVAIMKDEGASEVGGVIHCFSSRASFAAEALELGFFISFSGIVTFPRATDVQAAAAEVPLDRILAETDTPFLSPIPFRGRPNTPARVAHVVEKLAELRGLDAEEMADLTDANTRACFRLGDDEG